MTGLAGWNTYLSSASYTALGQPAAMLWGNNLTTSYAYWPGNQRLKQLQIPDLLNLQYTYDRVGNVATITDTVNSGQVQTFGYDARDRLTQAWTNVVGDGQYTQAWGYDWMGNIVTRTLISTPKAYAYGRPTEPVSIPVTMTHKVFFPLVSRDCDYCIPNATSGQPFAVISTTGGFRAEYDLNGNMTLRIELSGTQRITYTQAWNVENRLSVVAATNGVTQTVTQFYYDGDGKRVKRQDAGGVTVYIGAHFEKDITTNVATSYYYAGGQRVAMRRGSDVYPGLRWAQPRAGWLHGDHLGSTSLTTNSGGDFVARQLYHLFGTPRWNEGDLPTDYGYTAQRSEEAGLGSLYDYGARRYSPAIGRFLSADAIVPSPGNPQSLNRYSYGYNNPLKYIDPSGYDPLDAEWRRAFEEAHGRLPEWYDEQIRLFSLACMDEWDWSAFYNPDGTWKGREAMGKIFQALLPVAPGILCLMYCRCLANSTCQMKKLPLLEMWRSCTLACLLVLKTQVFVHTIALERSLAICTYFYRLVPWTLDSL